MDLREVEALFATESVYFWFWHPPSGGEVDVGVFKEVGMAIVEAVADGLEVRAYVRDGDGALGEELWNAECLAESKFFLELEVPFLD